MTGTLANLTDKRWGGYVPWFFRYRDYSGTGNFLQFFERTSHRIYQLIAYNESGIHNLLHFESVLESKSHQIYLSIKNGHGASDIASRIRDYFAPSTIKKEMDLLLYNDPEEVKLRELNETLARIGFQEPAIPVLPHGIMPARNATPAIDVKKMRLEHKQMASRMNSTVEQRELYSVRDWAFWKC
jgi:hypothetical protein